MSIVEKPTVNTAASSKSQIIEIPDWDQSGKTKTYRCYVILCKESDGFSAFCPQLPGAISEGDTKDEAFANIKDALKGIIESYVADSEPIPWLEKFDVPDEKIAEKWISINV